MIDLIPTQVFTASLVMAAGLTGFAIGAAGLTVLFFAPLSFKRLDYRRADSLVRLATKTVLPLIAGLSLAGAAFAFLGSAVVAGILLVFGAASLAFVRWILDPLPKKVRMAGAVRKHSKQRILALQVMLVLSMVFPVALIALAAQI